jgi:hypothetical protein
VFQPIWFAYDVIERFLGTNYDVEETINTEINTEDEVSENTFILANISDKILLYYTDKILLILHQ